MECRAFNANGARAACGTAPPARARVRARNSESSRMQRAGQAADVNDLFVSAIDKNAAAARPAAVSGAGAPGSSIRSAAGSIVDQNRIPRSCSHGAGGRMGCALIDMRNRHSAQCSPSRLLKSLWPSVSPPRAPPPVRLRLRMSADVNHPPCRSPIERCGATSSSSCTTSRRGRST